jgi:hypothetical protein
MSRGHLSFVVIVILSSMLSLRSFIFNSRSFRVSSRDPCLWGIPVNVVTKHLRGVATETGERLG